MMICSRLWLVLGLAGLVAGQYLNDTEESTPEGGRHRTPYSTTSSAGCPVSTTTETKWKTTTCYVTVSASPSVSTRYIKIYKTTYITISTTAINTVTSNQTFTQTDHDTSTLTETSVSIRNSTETATETSTSTATSTLTLTETSVSTQNFTKTAIETSTSVTTSTSTSLSTTTLTETSIATQNATETDTKTETSTLISTSVSTTTLTEPHNLTTTTTTSVGYPVTTTKWKKYTTTSIRMVPTTTTLTETTTQYFINNSTFIVPTTTTYYTTDFSTTTYTTIQNFTITSSYPVTTINEHTQYITTTFVTVSTLSLTKTIPLSYPVTITTTAVSLSTLPRQTITIPPSIATSIITTQLPGIRTTITLDGSTRISTLPGITAIRTTTITVDAETQTVTAPGATVTIGEPAVCPAPTNSGPVVPQDSGPNALWGCAPGFVCNVPKPAGCKLWAEPPKYDYICPENCCIPAPSFEPIVWPPGEVSYYPPTPGYFNFNPKAFGLDYGIFTKKVIVTYVIEHGIKRLETYTTGRWASQASLTHFPPVPTPKLKARLLKALRKRDLTVVPAVCFSTCNTCYKEAQRVGKAPSLCNADSPFQTGLISCRGCVEANGDTVKVTLQTYVEPQFAPFLDFCNSQAPQSEIEGPSTSTSTLFLTPQPVTQVVATETAPTPTETVDLNPVTVDTTPPPATSPLPSSPLSSTATSPTLSTSSSISTSISSSISSSIPKPTPTTPSSTAPTSNNGTNTPPPIQITGASSIIRPPTFYFSLTLVMLGAIIF